LIQSADEREIGAFEFDRKTKYAAAAHELSGTRKPSRPEAPLTCPTMKTTLLGYRAEYLIALLNGLSDFRKEV
jgi:hypothetical protein